MQDQKTKKDRRYERTHEAIIEAFTELVIQKDYDEITVKEVAERADINRKTFYFHFTCIEEILDEMQDSIAKKLMEIYRRHASGSFDFSAITATLNEIMSENYTLYRRLVMANSYRFFSRNIKDSVKDRFISQYMDGERGEILNLVAEYCISGIFKLYRVWFENPGNVSAEQLAELAGKMMWSSINAAMPFLPET